MSLEQMNAGNIESDRVDLEYFNKVRLGDAEAFSSLFRKYYESLYQFARRLVKDPQSAENVVQDVFVRIWLTRQECNIHSSVKSYLYTAVKNHSLNYLKREKTRIRVSEETNYQGHFNQTPEQELIEKENYEAVHREIEKLPEKCRQIYLMKRYDNLTYAEIAEILQISINTVKTQMKRAIKTLHKNLSYLVTSSFFLFK